MILKNLKKLFSPNELIDKLMQNPGPIKNFIFNRILAQVIPFNAPHSFNISKISKESITISLPFKKHNLNHVNGIHACALATLGEYCSGLLLLYNVGDRYRLILARLEADYHYQGKTAVTGQAFIKNAESESIINDLKSGKDIVYKEMITEIFDKEKNKIASIKAFWQVKNWKKVKLKI